MSLVAFKTEFQQTLLAGTLQRLVLSRPAGGELRRSFHVRPIEIRGESLFQITHRHPTRDTVENVSADRLLDQVSDLLGSSFLDANLESQTHSLSLRFSRKGSPHLSRKKLSSENIISVDHDRQKRRLLNPLRLPWLFDLGLSDPQGRILPSSSAKWRQIERFVELIDHSWRDISWAVARPLQIFDMGSGKGYLTFAIESWLTDQIQTPAQVCGIEQRPELVALCNKVALKHQRTALRFQSSQIAMTTASNIDVLIALHACNTATDDAIALGIRNDAQMIVCAPCCQHELRETIKGTAAIEGLLDHGLFRQRQAALLTDSLRTLVLEREGYHVRVTEFVDAGHTDKNLLLIATRTRTKSPVAQEKIDQLKSLFGISNLYLETVLT